MLSIWLISGPSVIIRVSEHGADRIREALRDKRQQYEGTPFERDWQDLIDLVNQEMNLFYSRQMQVRLRRPD